ncbi:hypothetical protein B296_00019536 [Ensete ventricosum]|uniref:Uncharacterized protein n=1 Tax=Ensete ventricosum TaxID=4639 RepID=A0A426Z7A9_ENSVE|nr:hypothetical protein B296_00019536 [Ensete ventricosum]
MARPFARAADHDQTTYRGGRPRPAPLQGRLAATKAFYGGSCQWHTRKGRPPATSPTASRGDGAGRKGGHPLVGRQLVTRGRRRQ